MFDRPCRRPELHELGVLWDRYGFLVVPMGTRHSSLVGIDQFRFC